METSVHTLNNKPKRVLLTGASGFIGSNLVPALLREGYILRVLLRNKKQITGLKGVEYFKGDLTDPHSLNGIEKDIDIVIHCAGILGKWGTDEALMHHVNVQGSLNLLEKFKAQRLWCFIHLSAAGVTGPVKETTVDESYPCKPATPYEKTKYLAEQQILARCGQMDIPVIVLRPTFTYGPGDPHKLALFKTIKKGRFAFIGSGESVSHPVYIDDLISGILLAVDSGGRGEIYIVGGERPVTKMELVYTIADALGVKRPKIKIPHRLAWPAASILEFFGYKFHFEPIITRARVMMMADNFGYSIQNAKTDLNYKPETDLPTGIARTVKSYIENGLL